MLGRGSSSPLIRLRIDGHQAQPVRPPATLEISCHVKILVDAAADQTPSAAGVLKPACGCSIVGVPR